MDYAIIRVGNKQHRVRDGETLVVDRVATDEGKSFSPDVLLGDGAAVTATVVGHGRGPKIRIGKYRRRTGYKRHNGFRAATSTIQISLAGAKKAAAPKREAPAVKAEAAPSPAPPAAAPAGEHVKGMPSGYEELTVAQVKEGSETWNRRMLEAALEYERANANRKGAVAALESALAAKEEK
jgi:large subunit ribosomal protein L21